MRRVLLMLLLLAGPAAAAEPDEVLQNPSLEARAVEIGQNLRCVVCASEPIESSRADMARDMRLLVRERIEAGDTDAQIYAFMQARYGDFVLFRPPFRPETWALWLGPFALMAGLIGWAALAARRRRAVPGPAPLTDAERAELDRLR